jgi:hypothetical protein
VVEQIRQYSWGLSLRGRCRALSSLSFSSAKLRAKRIPKAPGHYFCCAALEHHAVCSCPGSPPKNIAAKSIQKSETTRQPTPTNDEAHQTTPCFLPAVTTVVNKTMAAVFEAEERVTSVRIEGLVSKN